MEKLELIVSLAGLAVGIIATVATFVVKYVSNAKAKKLAEQTIEICNAVMPYITKAETFVNYTGEEKKEYVMTKANQYAIENNISFNKEQVSEKVEELVQLTKDVNQRQKDKVTKVQTITIPAR